MKLEELRAHLLSFRGATEGQPFGPDVLVYKVVKMFALVAWHEEPLAISLKCDPDEAIALRAIYPAVAPGYHLNKKHWNTVTLDGTIPSDEIEEMIMASYELVLASLTRAQCAQIGQ